MAIIVAGMLSGAVMLSPRPVRRPRPLLRCGKPIAGVIDSARAAVNDAQVDVDELLAKRPDDPLRTLCRQDLDPWSVNELHARMAALEAEIVRTAAKLEAAVNHRATADAIFKR